LVEQLTCNEKVEGSNPFSGTNNRRLPRLAPQSVLKTVVTLTRQWFDAINLRQLKKACMSRVPYTINVDQYVCVELERIRTMLKTLDFSGLAASVERVQLHATAMEDALFTYYDIKQLLTSKVSDTNISDAEFRKLATTQLEKLSR
jgi:hypothetical protein